MTAMSGELARITPERVQVELSKTLLQDRTAGGAGAVRRDRAGRRRPAGAVGAADGDRRAPPAQGRLRALADRAGPGDRAGEGGSGLRSPPDLVLRLAALLHDIGKPATRRHEPGGRVSFHHHEVVGAKLVRKRLTALRYPKDVVEAVARLTFLHLRFHGYGRGEWTDSAVRRYVTDAGDLLPRLHKLVRSDCTTRNRRRAAALSATYDSLERRIAELLGRRGPGAGAARPRRQRDHGAAGAAARAARSARPGGSSRTCGSSAARSPGTRPRPNCSAGGAPDPLTGVARSGHARATPHRHSPVDRADRGASPVASMLGGCPG